MKGQLHIGNHSQLLLEGHKAFTKVSTTKVKGFSRFFVTGCVMLKKGNETNLRILFTLQR
jgi:hypothetical protein